MDQLKRAKDLLKSANDLLEKDDLTGVAGLAYHAVESAIVYLTSSLNGKAKEGHTERRKRAEELLNLSKNSLKELWSSRNIDFYGNEKIGGEQKELTKESIKESVDKAEKIIEQAEDVVKKGSSEQDNSKLAKEKK